MLARIIAAKLADRVGAPVVVENRPGAGAVIGIQTLARAAPDGYTLALGSSVLAVAPTLYKKAPFDPNKDFAPVALVVHYPFLLVASASSPFNSVPELIRYAKEHPGKLLYASPGVATSQHLFAELFKTMTGTDLLHVPHKNSGEARNDVAGGHVQAMFDAVTAMKGLIEGSQVRALGTTGLARSEPNLPIAWAGPSSSRIVPARAATSAPSSSSRRRRTAIRSSSAPCSRSSTRSSSTTWRGIPCGTSPPYR